MNEAKALRHVELLARIVSTYEEPLRAKGDVHFPRLGFNSSLAATIRDLRLALVELDLARSENAPSIYEDGR